MNMEGIMEETEPDGARELEVELRMVGTSVKCDCKNDGDMKTIMDQLEAIHKRLAKIEEESKELRQRVDKMEALQANRTSKDENERLHMYRVNSPKSFGDFMKPRSSDFSVDVLPDNSATFLSPESRPHSDLDIKMYYAAKDGRVDDIRNLISETKSDENLHCGCNALLTAAWNGHVDVVSELLLSGADVNVVNTWTSESPLHYAAFDGNAEMVALLLCNGADVNVRNLLGKTPLHIAVLKGFDECVHLLLDAGADPYVEDNKGKKPSEYCESTSVLKLLNYYKTLATNAAKAKHGRK